MKDPHPLSDTWMTSSGKDPVLMSVPSVHKKFKRKSREPKRLFSGPEPDGLESHPADASDGGSPDLGRLPPLQQRQLMLGQEVAAAGIPSGTKGGPAQNGAIDMRIGGNLPAVSSKLSQFSNPEIVHWPAAISQPLSNRFKLGPRFPLSSSGGSPRHQAFSLDPPLSSQTLPVPRAQQSLDHVDFQVHSPKESSRKRVGANTDGPGRLPEVKAIQQTRRLLANARERTRVHTISAAFEALRKQVPCYSYGQKLSKLAILRIACNYILSLAQLAELDYSSDHGSLNFSQCVEQCTRTLQAEGRSKKRKAGRMPEDV